MDDEEAITSLVTHAIASPEGRLRLATAEEFIIGELERNRFNTERAVEVYRFAIDHALEEGNIDLRPSRLDADKADTQHSGLLSSRRRRPHCGPAAEKRDEIATIYSIEWHRSPHPASTAAQDIRPARNPSGV
jgi:hypothetical protein